MKYKCVKAFTLDTYDDDGFYVGGGLAALKKQEATRTVEDFNRNIQNRNYLLREARRYTR